MVSSSSPVPPRLYTVAEALEKLTPAFQSDEVGPFSEQSYFAIDLRSSSTGGASGWSTIAPILTRLPCPVIGVNSKYAPMDIRSDPFDVLVDTTADFNRVVATITNAPIAAMTFVQTLRSTQNLSIDDALTVESLAYAALQQGPEFKSWFEQFDKARPPKTEIENTLPVLVDRQNGHLTLVLNRPEHRNAVNVAMRDALVEGLELVAADQTISHVTVSGNGKCFCIGGDLEEFGLVEDPATAHAIRSLRLPARSLVRCRDRVRFHLHGACIGAGVELSAFASHVTATPNTFFQLPELQFGLIPGAGGCVSLPRRIGRQRTAYLALTGKRLRATQALDWNLIDAIAD